MTEPSPLLPPEIPDDKGSSNIGGTMIATFLGAVAFYTTVPIPTNWRLEFRGIARWVPVIGLAIGGLLGGIDFGLAMLGMPQATRSVLVIAAWIGITGGLHLDGAMDTADGLAVLEPERRLQVMADSHTGAFGVMAAVILVVLKLAALMDLPADRWLVFMLVAGWGRWGQLVAIARYPYLKATGKGAFHKEAIHSFWEVVPTLLLMVGMSVVQGYHSGNWLVGAAIGIGGAAIAILVATWFNRKLGGHTGDTYGATVEWTEALLLCLLTVIL